MNLFALVVLSPNLTRMPALLPGRQAVTCTLNSSCSRVFGLSTSSWHLIFLFLTVHLNFNYVYGRFLVLIRVVMTVLELDQIFLLHSSPLLLWVT